MKIKVVQGDITRMEVDVIVNAANAGLMGGGGVDGAIHRAGGPSIMRECAAIREEKNGCPTGDVAFTGAGLLKAKYIAHAVGPIWRGGGSGEPELLRSCYARALEGAEARGAGSIAFPCISAGIYGYPKRLAAQEAAAAARAFAPRATSLKELIFVVYDGESLGIYKELFPD